MSKNFERKATVEQAYSIAERTISDFNLRSEVEAYGADIQTFRCKLIDDTNKKIFFGFGKGLGLQSKVSACYEALEHFAVHHFTQKTANEIDAYQKVEGFDKPVPCVQLAEVDNNTQLVFPIYMLDPRYAKCKSELDMNDYRRYSWRANDSGIASGTDVIEAGIHALNEIVERDAHSLFLIEGFVRKHNKNIKLIDKTTIPSRLRDIVCIIESQYSDNLMLFDITSDIGIPVIYVSMTNQQFLIQPSGCGASLSREYALERALLECLQPLHIYNETLFDNQKQIIESLASAPLLQKAAIADVLSLRSVWQDVDYVSLPNYTQHCNLEDQLDLIIKKIKVHGYEIFTIPLAQQLTGFTCLKYLVPGLEDFHLVQTGKRILPNQRGMHLLGAKNEKKISIAQPEFTGIHGGSAA